MDVAVIVIAQKTKGLRSDARPLCVKSVRIDGFCDGLAEIAAKL
jgi:hypothetical protein